MGGPFTREISMTDAIRSIFVTGLRNAHAMENQALSIMKPQISRIENYPAIASRLEEMSMLGGVVKRKITLHGWSVS